MNTTAQRSGVHARQRGTTWYVRVSYRGARTEHRTDATTRAEAERVGRAMLADYEAGRANPDAARTRVVDLWADLETDYRVNERHVQDLRKRWNHLGPVFGRDLATDVTTPRLRRYVERRLGEDAARATVKLELAALHRAFVLGVEAGKVVRVPVFPTVSVSNARTGFVDASEFARLLAELSPELRVLAVLAHAIGWRRGELLGLEWRQVNLETGEVRLDPGTTKNGDGRVVFLPSDALAELRAWRHETLEVERAKGVIVRWVCHRDGARIADHYDAWRAACDRAGVPGLLLHDLRRSAARDYVRSGVAEAVVMRVLGHRTRSMLDRYNIVSERDLREAAQRVEAGAGAGERRADVVAITAAR